jgi:hypothetical protein
VEGFGCLISPDPTLVDNKSVGPSADHIIQGSYSADLVFELFEVHSYILKHNLLD